MTTLSAWVLVFMTGQGDVVEVAAYDTLSDCESVVNVLIPDLSAPANAFCEPSQ